jgi:hypothetical protein
VKTNFEAHLQQFVAVVVAAAEKSTVVFVFEN